MSAPEWLQPLLAAVANADATTYASPRPDPEDSAPRRSAVLVLFGEGPTGPDVLLLQRSPHLRSHAGQPAFPGGGEEPADADPVETALREAQEETGVDPAGVEVLATLPELWLPPSGNLVTPVLAWWARPGDIRAVDEIEVASVARVPIAELADPANRSSVRHPLGYVGPSFQVADMCVWGFTAGILDRLLVLGGWEQDWDRAQVRPLPRQALL